MPALPDADPAPPGGELPAQALEAARGRPFGIYLHVPFCAVRCGYCDFNTYTLGELVDGAAAPPAYRDAVLAEIDLATAVLAPLRPRVDTVFVGGGTPTLLGPAGLRPLLEAVEAAFGLAPDAEVTVEANPDSVTAEDLAALAAGGVTRVSLGMQSAVPHVLATLDRTHRPDNVAAAVRAARGVGLQTSVDLIYGTPGESLEDWRASLEAAIALDPDHLSAYALVVEEGTRLAARVRRGEVLPPEDDDEATKYELADALLEAAGYGWYEVSNWSRDGRTRCRHNEGYWGDGSWWGLGPGAHSHVGGVRWWNVKHPSAYAARLADGISPAAARETLTGDQRRDERVLLGVRTRAGLPLGALAPPGREAVAGLIADGLVDAVAAVRDRHVVLTCRGRLLADTVVRRLLGMAG